MTLPEISIRRHVLAWMISAIFVLLGIIQYPESQLFSLVQSLRPIMIASLFWMSIELIFRTTAMD